MIIICLHTHFIFKENMNFILLVSNFKTLVLKIEIDCTFIIIIKDKFIIYNLYNIILLHL